MPKGQSALQINEELGCLSWTLNCPALGRRCRSSVYDNDVFMGHRKSLNGEKSSPSFVLRENKLIQNGNAKATLLPTLFGPKIHYPMLRLSTSCEPSGRLELGDFKLSSDTC